MFKIFTRKALAGAATAAMIGTSLLLAPAAEAAPRSTHLAAGSGAGAQHDSFSFRVGDHRDRLTLDPIGTAVQQVEIDGKRIKVSARYRISLSHGKRALITTRASTYPALLASLSTAVSRNRSDKEVRATIMRAAALPAREAKAGIEATSEQLANEATAVAAAGHVVLDVQQWRAEHPEQTTLTEYALPAEWAHVGDGLGADLTVSGTPQHYSVRAVIAANGATFKLDDHGKARYSATFLSGHVLRNRIR